MTILPKEPSSREVTSEAVYLRRREFISNSAKAAGTAVLTGGGLLWLVGNKPPPNQPEPPALVSTRPAAAAGPYDAAEPETSYRDGTTYNNFYLAARSGA